MNRYTDITTTTYSVYHRRTLTTQGQQEKGPSLLCAPTYRARFPNLRGARSGGHPHRLRSHTVHRLQALAANGHLLLVVVVVALLLAHKQLIAVARKVGRTLRDVLGVVEAVLGRLRVCLKLCLSGRCLFLSLLRSSWVIGRKLIHVYGLVQ